LYAGAVVLAISVVLGDRHSVTGTSFLSLTEIDLLACSK
jgi:hypothetical protein